MGKIKQLSLAEAHKIAAGEVVERPANVVKELIENALDAGGKTISIYIEQAGKKLIRVVDDGSGMDQEDALLCFSPHATSKINTVDELYTLKSFGFRGEALTSIAAVSKVQLITKDSDSTVAIKVYKEGQETIKKEFVSAPQGTDISINDLFYNVPARKKFLKTEQTELRAITQLFNAFCFDYPDIHFKLYTENTLTSNIPPVDSFEKRVKQVWQTYDMSYLAEQKFDHGTITGLISGRHFYRYDRSNIFFFVNKRWVKNSALTKALLKGYLNVLPSDRYPAAVVALSIDPTLIDVNIHPRKEEIQFLHPRIVESFITACVKKNLEESLSKSIGLSSPPPLSPTKENKLFSQIRSLGTINRYQESYPTPSPLIQPSVSPLHHLELEQREDTLQQKSADEKIQPFFEQELKQKILVQADEPVSYTVVGVYKNTYIMIHHADNLVMVDQHAAHERIMYEQFKQRFGHVETVSLIFPVIVSLSDRELSLVRIYRDIFIQHGLGVEEFGHKALVVNAAPLAVKNVSLPELIRELLVVVETHEGNVQGLDLIHEKIHAQMACKAAVKAGDVLTAEQIKQLLDDLYKIPNRFVCPHGRPTVWNISDYEIERKFKRV